MNNPIALKICGMKYNNNVRDIAVLRPDYMGFILYPYSPRYAGDKITRVVMDKLPPTIQKIGVFVNQRTTAIMRRMDEMGFNYAQLHGDETLADVRRLTKAGHKVIKVFRIDNDFDFAEVEPFVPHVSFFLFDTKGEKYGGTGKKWNWDKLNDYTYPVKFFLSGGIGPNDVHTIKSINHPMLEGVDVNSHFEDEPGQKDRARLESFIQQLR